MATLARVVGIARSLLIYYGIPLRGRRLRRFYAAFVAPGTLCFDLGAHVGNRVRAWRALGARVVAVEPQASCVRILQRLFERDSLVTILPLAVGSAEGAAQLLISERTPTVTTLSADWARRVGMAGSFRNITWARGPEVGVTSLDRMIARYGQPDFVKIDVEGMEADVLQGLSTPIVAVSFEYVPATRDIALACIERLARLGAYRFNWSVGETLRLASPRWLDATEMRRVLSALPDDARSGDVYAKLGFAVAESCNPSTARVERAQ